ncbi:hypothetical protein Bca4012_050525 [Brassica carinata]|uniref:Uncharacterized protein n=1 Tax=Brassica carinata TaxID=52824 RepID=A0A8X7RB91_BRACI|nr:hypothetical protein Bca52824_053229 [Brassica carinata]
MFSVHSDDRKKETPCNAEEDGGGGDVEEDDNISGVDLQPAFLAQSSSSRSLGHEIKLLRRVFAISSWSSCSAPSSIRRPYHGRAHLATMVPPPTRPSSRNPHSPSDNAAVTSARVVAASSEAPESLPLTVAVIFRLKSSETPQWWIFNYLHS